MRSRTVRPTASSWHTVCLLPLRSQWATDLDATADRIARFLCDQKQTLRLPRPGGCSTGLPLRNLTFACKCFFQALSGRSERRGAHCDRRPHFDKGLAASTGNQPSERQLRHAGSAHYEHPGHPTLALKVANRNIQTKLEISSVRTTCTYVSKKSLARVWDQTVVGAPVCPIRTARPPRGSLAP